MPCLTLDDPQRHILAISTLILEFIMGVLHLVLNSEQYVQKSVTLKWVIYDMHMICMRSKLLKANLLGRYFGNFCDLFRAETEDAPMILSGVLIIHTCWGVSNKLAIFLTHLHSWINHISKLPHMIAWLDKRGCGEHISSRRWQWCASRWLWNETDVDANDGPDDREMWTWPSL